MVESVPLLLAICAFAVVAVGLVAIVGFVIIRFVLRGVGGLPTEIFGALGGILGDENAESANFQASRARRRSSGGLRDMAVDLDFDAAVARHASDADAATPDPDHSVSDERLSPSPVKTQSPISGRIMRDGRYRRVTGGTPGREKDQDFRRVGDERPLPDFDMPEVEKPLRRKRRDRNQDELFGGMLDEDGDGDLDFLA